MVDSVSGTTRGSSATTSKINKIRPEDFLKIMVKELQQQDPFEPVSSKDLVSQVGQVRDIQSSMELSQTLKDLAISQKISAAGTLMGKEVTGLNSDGDSVKGIVTSVRREGDKVFLELDSGQRLSVDNVLGVNGAKIETDTQSTLTTDNEEKKEDQA